MRLHAAALLLASLGSTAFAQEAEIRTEIAAAREEALQSLSKEKRAMAEKLLQPVPLLEIGEGPLSLKAGEWGRLVRVEALRRGPKLPSGPIDARSVDGYRALRANVDSESRFTDFDVSEVIDETTVLVFDYSLWIRGVDTTELADEGSIDLAPHIFEVKGTKRYRTVDGGQRTVRELVAIDSDADVRVAAARLRELATFRVWRDKSGKFEVLARYVGFKGGKVQLEGLDGKQAAVALVRLADDEQAYVREAVKAAKPRKPKR